MADVTAPPGALRASLDANVHESVGIAAPVLAGLLAFFAISDLFVTPSRWAVQIALFDAACALAFLLTYVVYRVRKIPHRHAHAVAASLAGLNAVDILHDTYLLGDPEQTTYLMLLIVASGSIFLHLRWLYVIVLGSLVGWLVVAASHPSVNWTTFGFALFASCVLSILIHMVRLNTFERMEVLRLAESSRKEQLEIRESALEAAVEALQESEDRYRRLVDGAPDAFLVHSDGQVVFANAAAVKLFGLGSEKDLLGKDPFLFLHPDDQNEARRRHLLGAQEGRAMDPLEVRCVRADGTVIDVEMFAQPITFLGRPAEQTVIHDVSDRKRAEADRQVASHRLAEISRLQEMDRVKTQFVNTISHELRTPLTPIKVQLHMLKTARDLESARRPTQVLERNVQRLAGLVDELLEVARIQAGTLKLAKTFLEVGPTVAQALESYADVARQQGIELASKIEPGVEVVADPKRLQQVMYNLLGNAFKFTHAGGRIEVEVRREKGDALVSVRDTGAGMDPREIERLFEPFSQIHDTMEQTNAGTGLGLYISRGIIEGHGGRIWAESEGKGKGSRFAFALPLEPAGG